MPLTTRHRRMSAWIGLVLILVNLLAPTIAHAVRGPGTVSALLLPAWCSMAAPDGAAPAAADGLAETAGLDAEDLASAGMACPFCGSAALAFVLPTAESAAPGHDDRARPALPRAQRPSVLPEGLARAHRSRAPPRP